MTHLALPGSFTRAKKLYWRLPTDVRDRVCGLGFNGILDNLMEGPKMLRSRQAAMTALIERWSDCTHTFHFQFKEMMIMPLDFAGQRIPFDILDDLAGLCHDLLGYPPKFRVYRGGLISYDRL